MYYKSKNILSTFLLILTVSVGALTQVPDRVETNLVLVDVLVMDRSGKPVRGLAADRFELFTDNKRRAIEVFSTASAPVTFGIVYDMHPTTSDRTKAVIESLRAFRKQLQPEDDVFLIAFDKRGQQAFDFIPAFDQLERHMTDPKEPHIQALYDAVYFASEKIQTSRNRKRVLIILSDGNDHQSRHTFKDLKKQFASIRTELYAVVVDDSNNLGYQDLSHEGRPRYPIWSDVSPLERAALIDLAEKTGGSTYFGGSAGTSRLQGTLEEIAEEMRSHYTLGFYPSELDDRLHTLKITLNGVDHKQYVLTYQPNYIKRTR